VKPVRSGIVIRPHRALFLMVTWWWLVVSPAAAQEEDAYDGRSTDETVRFVVGGLIAIALATAVLMLVFIWHTSPRRRQRVASRRGAGAVDLAPTED
jgi:hypothetical protein